MSTKNKSIETESLLDNIEGFLQEALAQLEPLSDDHNGPGRPRILPAMCLWAGMLVCVLRGYTSQQALWRLLTLEQLWYYPRFEVSDQAIYNRLAKAGTGPLEQIFSEVSAVLRERLAPFEQKTLAPFASGVVAIDETTLDPVARMLPTLREVPPGDRQLLPGKLAGVFDIRLQQWRQVVHIPDPGQNEKVIARSLLSDVAVGTLILADMGYFGFKWFDDLTAAGYWWLSRLRNKTSYEVLHTYYEDGETFDGIVWLGAYRADRAAHAVRLVTFRRGGQRHRYITNVRDPQVLSMKEVAALYARRWDIELSLIHISEPTRRH